MPDTSPIIEMFQQHAQLLDAQGANHTIDDAIWKLGGGILFNEGLRQRMTGRP